MLGLTSLIVTAVMLMLPLSVQADVRIGLRLGDSFISGGDGGLRARIVLGNDPYRRYRHDRYRHGHYRYRVRREPLFGQPGRPASRIGSREVYERVPAYPRHHYPLVIGVPVRDRVTPSIAQPKALPPAQPVAAPPVPVVRDPAPVPDDPAGHARLVPARGVKPVQRRQVEIGNRLPLGVPHVIIDPRRYDLPLAPPGEIYARIHGQVYRIEPTTRRVTALVPAE